MAERGEEVALRDIVQRLRAFTAGLEALADEAASPRSTGDLGLLVRGIIQARRIREQQLGPDLFFDPGWDILLTLFLARLEDREVPTVALGAIPVPSSTILRWTMKMEESGLVVRRSDEVDRRRVYVSLADDMVEKMTTYFESVRAQAI